jgi:beta-glucosidase
LKARGYRVFATARKPEDVERLRQEGLESLRLDLDDSSSIQNAVADVLFGRENPAGRLPVTMPRTTGQVPLYYDHKPSGAVSMFRTDYSDCPVTPLYPFGHGLSYTSFEYGDLQLSASEPAPTDTLRISFRVRNSGTRPGEEVAQLYVRDRVGSVTRPVKELKGFKRIALEPGRSRRITFELSLAQLAFYDGEMRLVAEPGEVAVMVGASSDDIRLERSIRIRGETAVVERSRIVPTTVQVE